MEDRVSEDRPGVVVEPDEVREVEALGVVQAEHDAVDERVEEEAGQDRQDRQEEQQVDRARAASGAGAGRLAVRSRRVGAVDRARMHGRFGRCGDSPGASRLASGI